MPSFEEDINKGLQNSDYWNNDPNHVNQDYADVIVYANKNKGYLLLLLLAAFAAFQILKK